MTMAQVFLEEDSVESSSLGEKFDLKLFDIARTCRVYCRTCSERLKSGMKAGNENGTHEMAWTERVETLFETNFNIAKNCRF